MSPRRFKFSTFSVSVVLFADWNTSRARAKLIGTSAASLGSAHFDQNIGRFGVTIRICALGRVSGPSTVTGDLRPSPEAQGLRSNAASSPTQRIVEPRHNNKYICLDEDLYWPRPQGVPAHRPVALLRRAGLRLGRRAASARANARLAQHRGSRGDARGGARLLFAADTCGVQRAGEVAEEVVALFERLDAPVANTFEGTMPKLAECIALGARAAPGLIETGLAPRTSASHLDTVTLPAATTLHLTSGKPDQSANDPWSGTRPLTRALVASLAYT
ncbi:hypothetical protein BC834DRAFT_968733 [Gloeopeniophorella convolvens]|nr:hypothetical protein BC834DRAFT_968733 [Gloeopeniophorella convolvens]